MLIFLQSIIIFLLLSICSVIIHSEKSEIKSFSKKWKLKDDDNTFFIPADLRSIINQNENSIVYAICGGIKPNHFKCNVTKEIWAFKHGTYKMTCEDINITAYYLLEDMFLNTFLYVLSKEKLLLLTELSTDNQELLIIDIPTCSTTNIKPENNTKFNIHRPVLHKNQLEVFQSLKSNKSDNETLYLSWNSYDFEGKKLDYYKPTVSPFDPADKNYIYWVFPASFESFSKGLYIYNFNVQPLNEYRSKYSHELIYANTSLPNEFTKILRGAFKEYIYIYAYSNDHNRFSMCWYYPENKRVVDCAQFFADVLKFNVTLKLYEDAKWIAVRNLPDGGLLVFTGYCENLNLDEAAGRKCHGFRVQKIASNGKLSPPLYINGIHFEKSVIFRSINDMFHYDLVVTENEESEYCLIWAITFPGQRYADENRPIINSKELSYEKRCIPNIYIH